VSAPTPDADRWLDATQDFRAPLLALVLLAVLAGYADAVALLQWDVFVANQSGNVVRTGMGLAGAYTEWQTALLSVVSFGIGGAVSYLVGRRTRRVAPPAARLLLTGGLLAAWLVLVAVVASGSETARVGSVALLALAMGVIATTFVRLGGIQVTTTYATGAVLRVGQGAARVAVGAPADRARARRAIGVTAAMLVSYAAGGAVGTAASTHLSDLVRSVPALVLLAAVAVLLRRVRIEERELVSRPGSPG
jgi:uncharacterized membrane protein YoaK (UPF0700 family)